MDLLVFKEILIDDDYQLRNLTGKEKVIVDVGGGWGDFSISAAKRCPLAKVFVWEPDKKYYLLLMKNIRRNQISNIYAFNKPVTSLTQIFATINTREVSVLKMDCEGAEYEIFNKGKDKLKQINKIVMEYHNNVSDNGKVLADWLREAGFKIKMVSQRGVNGLGLLYAGR